MYKHYNIYRKHYPYKNIFIVVLEVFTKIYRLLDYHMTSDHIAFLYSMACDCTDLYNLQILAICR